MESGTAELRILLLGGASAELKADLARLGGGAWVIEPPAGRDPLGEIAFHAPHLVVLGEDAPCEAARLVGSEDERDLIPVLSLNADPGADLRLPTAPGEREAVLRTAGRLARLRAVVAPLGAESFAHRLRQEFSRALRYRHPVSLLALRVDAEEALRRTHGPAAVEQYHAALAERLRRCLRDVDLLFRASPAEIFAILPETPATGGALVAERFRSQTAHLVFKPAVAGARPMLPIKATSSVGIADGPREGIGSADHLLASARHSVQAARLDGGDRVTVQAPPTEGIEPPPTE